MDSEIQVHILSNLTELNKSVAAMNRGQDDIVKRLDVFGPWVQQEIQKVDDKVEDAKKEIGLLKTWRAVSSLKLGTITAGAGAALTFTLQWAAVHFFGLKIR